MSICVLKTGRNNSSELRTKLPITDSNRTQKKLFTYTQFATVKLFFAEHGSNRKALL